MRYYTVEGYPVCGDHIHAEISQWMDRQPVVMHQTGGEDCVYEQGAVRGTVAPEVSRAVALLREVLDSRADGE